MKMGASDFYYFSRVFCDVLAFFIFLFPNILFAAHIARQFIEKIPELRLTLDISHWTCVAGSLLYDQEETVLKALERTDHIHSRVGLKNGPQIPDHRAPDGHVPVPAQGALTNPGSPYPPLLARRSIGLCFCGNHAVESEGLRSSPYHPLL